MGKKTHDGIWQNQSSQPAADSTKEKTWTNYKISHGQTENSKIKQTKCIVTQTNN